MTTDQAKAYIIKASRVYFAAQPITEAVRADHERKEVLKWLDDTQELLRKVANYIAEQEAAKPSKTGKALAEDIERLMMIGT